MFSKVTPILTGVSDLCHLTTLDLSLATLKHQDKSISLILNKCTKLTTLNLSRGVKLLGDEAFTALPILAPLVELNMDFCLWLTLADRTLEAFGFYLSKSLVKLKMNNCLLVTVCGILRLLEETEGTLSELEINGELVKDYEFVRMLLRKDYLSCNVYFDDISGTSSAEVMCMYRELILAEGLVNCAAMKRLFFKAYKGTVSFDSWRK
jgi:hypothetical protein